MWLLTSEPQSAWLVLSHDQGAPPVVRFHQPFGSWACSSKHPPLLPPTLTQSTAVHFTLSTNQRLYSLYSPQLLYHRGTAVGLHPFTSSPQKGQGKSTTSPSNQPPGNFISPTFASCGKSSLQFDLPHHQSGFLASFLSCPNPPK